MQPEYKDHNKIILTLYCAGKSYTISNINKTGFISKATNDDSGPHLKSFTMNLVQAGKNNTAAVGSTGKLVVVDCNDAILKFLMNGYDIYKKDAKQKDGTFPRFLIQFDCFTGHYDWGGTVRKWDLSFTEGPPTLTFDWVLFPIDVGEVSDKNLREEKLVDMLYRPAMFYNVGALLDAVQNKYFPDFKIDFVYVEQAEYAKSGKVYKNAEVADKLKFKRGCLTIDPSNIPRTESVSQLYLFYQYIAQNVCTTDNEPVFFSQYMSTELSEKDRSAFAMISVSSFKEGKFEDANTKAMNSLVFTFNGNKPAYSSFRDQKGNEKFYIPVENYSCALDNATIHLHQVMIGTINGTYCGTSEGACKAIDANDAQNSAKANAETKNSFMFKFKCSNVACFQCNNTAAPVCIDIYNEQGIKRDYLSVTNALVTEVTYSLDGPVISADVTCSTAIGNLNSNSAVQKGQDGEDGKDDSGSTQSSITDNKDNLIQ